MGRVMAGRYEFTVPWETRFWAKVQPGESPFHCWLWQAGRNEDGYGRFHCRRLGVSTILGTRAHRLAYFLFHGALPPQGLVLDHLCRNPGCVNPLHLEAVTNRENIRRGYPFHGATGMARIQQQKTHCLHGHEFTPENTYYRQRQGVSGVRTNRQCRACLREWRMRHMRQAKQAKQAKQGN